MAWVAWVGMALQMHSQRMQGEGEQAQAGFDEQVANENSRRSKLSAANARLVGSMAEEAKRREVQKSIGRSAAASSQSGTGGPSSGSNALLLKQAATEGEYDARAIRYDASMDAYNFENEALNYDTMALAARRKARGAKNSMPFNIAGGALNGYSNYSGMMSSTPQSSSSRTGTKRTKLAGY